MARLHIMLRLTGRASRSCATPSPKKRAGAADASAFSARDAGRARRRRARRREPRRREARPARVPRAVPPASGHRATCPRGVGRRPPDFPARRRPRAAAAGCVNFAATRCAARSSSLSTLSRPGRERGGRCLGGAPQDHFRRAGSAACDRFDSPSPPSPLPSPRLAVPASDRALARPRARRHVAGVHRHHHPALEHRPRHAAGRPRHLAGALAAWSARPSPTRSEPATRTWTARRRTRTSSRSGTRCTRRSSGAPCAARTSSSRPNCGTIGASRTRKASARKEPRARPWRTCVSSTSTCTSSTGPWCRSAGRLMQDCRRREPSRAARRWAAESARWTRACVRDKWVRTPPSAVLAELIRVAPASTVNQIEIHAEAPETSTLVHRSPQSRGVQVTAYSPLARGGGLLDHDRRLPRGASALGLALGASSAPRRRRFERRLDASAGVGRRVGERRVSDRSQWARRRASAAAAWRRGVGLRGRRPPNKRATIGSARRARRAPGGSSHSGVERPGERAVSSSSRSSAREDARSSAAASGFRRQALRVGNCAGGDRRALPSRRATSLPIGEPSARAPQRPLAHPVGARRTLAGRPRRSASRRTAAAAAARTARARRRRRGDGAVRRRASEA